MEVLPELEPPFRTITGSTRSTIAGRCNALGDGKDSIAADTAPLTDLGVALGPALGSLDAWASHWSAALQDT